MLLVCLSLSLFLYKRPPTQTQKTLKLDAEAAGAAAGLPKGYLLHNEVTHARLLPKDSKHAFTYPRFHRAGGPPPRPRQQGVKTSRIQGPLGATYLPVGSAVSRCWHGVYPCHLGEGD